MNVSIFSQLFWWHKFQPWLPTFRKLSNTLDTGHWSEQCLGDYRGLSHLAYIHCKQYSRFLKRISCDSIYFKPNFGLLSIFVCSHRYQVLSKQSPVFIKSNLVPTSLRHLFINSSIWGRWIKIDVDTKALGCGREPKGGMGSYQGTHRIKETFLLWGNPYIARTVIPIINIFPVMVTEVWSTRS